jgi:hypothetical protein
VCPGYLGVCGKTVVSCVEVQPSRGYPCHSEMPTRSLGTQDTSVQSQLSRGGRFCKDSELCGLRAVPAVLAVCSFLTWHVAGIRSPVNWA